ncbi:hypothetical protein Pint_11590 [Pistacia integerrima]|uniref:Uncharacterized protein n=1 Tax=Pistacia integerrima TaxID=434235 RepID=A0ACC0XG65_9ROSI|nr:hypothetical protein Pint_11590 [Pistacia integerrima]
MNYLMVYGVTGTWEHGSPLALVLVAELDSRRRLSQAGEDCHYDPERKEMRTGRKGHKVDRIASEKRENTAKWMGKMPEMLLDHKKRRWEKKMKEEGKAKENKCYLFKISELLLLLSWLLKFTVQGRLSH